MFKSSLGASVKLSAMNSAPQKQPSGEILRQTPWGATVLKNISTDSEALRMSGMNHEEIRKCLEEKYGAEQSGDVRALINLHMGKKGS